MNLKEIINCIENISPLELAEGFDNVGLLIGEEKKEVKKVLLSLDVDENVVDEAILYNADLIISHHPVIFSPIKEITDKSPSGRVLLSLIKNNIAVYSAHTNLDTANGGLNDYFCDILNLKVLRPLDEGGCGRICEGDIKVKDLIDRCKKAFNLPYIRVSGDEEKYLKKIAVCTGGGSSFVEVVINEKVDAYITGDLSYNKARDLYFNNITHIEIDHYESEIIVKDVLYNILEREFKDKLEIKKSDANFNIYKLY